ncbi:MAG TPA: gamma-glutamylcyclotransferase family protein [Candidatus Eisenbacteria bacterium]|nr:gamma-glutamylcyclotransferase family protein [Candidatus Eisenbacteria bacterium]
MLAAAPASPGGPSRAGAPMFYFAYGSNLDPEQMARRCPGYVRVGLAALRDHRLVFPVTSHDWGGGVAGVQAAHGATVWGMVYDLSEEAVAALDRYEGFRAPGDHHNLYDREGVFVDLTRPDDGSIPRRLRAWIYVARPANPSPPSRRYLGAIVTGARFHQLPEEYVSGLAATPTLD